MHPKTPIDLLAARLRHGRRKRLLFVSERGAARAIIAEAIVNRYGASGYQAASAGRRPAARVHPMAEEMMRAFRVSSCPMPPRAFDPEEAASFDYVISLHDQMKGEPCPLRDAFRPDAAWDVADPRDRQNPQGRVVSNRLAFVRAYCGLRRRIGALLAKLADEHAPAHAFNARHADAIRRDAEARAVASRRPALPDFSNEPLTLSRAMLLPPERK